MIRGFAQSTIDAAVWLLCYRPEAEALEWIRSRGAGLEAVAREQIEQSRKRRANTTTESTK